MTKLAPYWKSVAGFLAPGVALFLAAIADGSITQAEWVRIVTACVAGAAGVYVAPKNAAKGARNEGGYVDLGLACLVTLAVVVTLWWFGVRPH